jgi:hypothetical protein
MHFHDKKFDERHAESDVITYSLMEKLFESKKIKAFVKMKKDVDIEGTDYTVTFDEFSKEKIQFKIRMWKYQDIPVTRLQPFLGYGNHVTGRDYRSLVENKNKFYFVASQNSKKQFDKISITEAEKLRDLVLEAEKEWFPRELPWAYIGEKIYQDWIAKGITNRRLKKAENGVIACFKKNYFEKYGKINYYIPSKYVDRIIVLD